MPDASQAAESIVELASNAELRFCEMVSKMVTDHCLDTLPLARNGNVDGIDGAIDVTPDMPFINDILFDRFLRPIIEVGGMRLALGNNGYTSAFSTLTDTAYLNAVLQARMRVLPLTLEDGTRYGYAGSVCGLARRICVSQSIFKPSSVAAESVACGSVAIIAGGVMVQYVHMSASFSVQTLSPNYLQNIIQTHMLNSKRKVFP